MRVRQFTVEVNGQVLQALRISAEPGSTEVGESFVVSFPEGIKTFKSLYWFSQWSQRQYGERPKCEMGEYLQGPQATEYKLPENFPTVGEWEEFEKQERQWLEN